LLKIGIAPREAIARYTLDALAPASGRAKSNLSRTLQTMARYGWVPLERAKAGSSGLL
jgi:predicted transcriptional regulator